MFGLCRVATEVDDRQGLSDVGSPLRHVILTQVHVLLAIIRLQAFNLLPVLAATHEPSAGAQQGKQSQQNLSPVHNLV